MSFPLATEVDRALDLLAAERSSQRCSLKGGTGEGQVEEQGWAHRRRRPEGTVLHETVKDNLATLLEEASEVGRGLPRYVERDVSPAPGVRSAGARLRAGALRELRRAPDGRAA